MDDCPTQHSYNTRSKRKKRTQKQTKGKKALGKSDVKSIRNSKSKIKMDVSNHSSIIEELVTHKPMFKDSDSDYNPEDDEYLRYLDALEDEENLQIHLKLCKDDVNGIEDDVDEHGNIKGLINYDYESDEKGTSSEELKNVGILYSFLTKSLISAIEGIDEKSEDDGAAVSTHKDTTTKDRYTKRNLYKRYTPIERNYYENISVEERDRIFELEREIAKESDDVPLRFKILNTPFPLKIKKKLLDKVDVLNHIDKGNSEYYKLKRWVDGLMRVPFGKYIDPPVSKKDTPDDISKYIVQAYDTLDKAVYGHEDAKTEIMLAISKWISNPSSHGNVIGIQGPPGNGKTTLVRKGISKAINRPFAFITLGGATDASFLEGHSYTYEGSIPVEL